jgi:hypothetical protein
MMKALRVGQRQLQEPYKVVSPNGDSAFFMLARHRVPVLFYGCSSQLLKPKTTKRSSPMEIIHKSHRHTKGDDGRDNACYNLSAPTCIKPLQADN